MVRRSGGRPGRETHGQPEEATGRGFRQAGVHGAEPGRPPPRLAAQPERAAGAAGADPAERLSARRQRAVICARSGRGATREAGRGPTARPMHPGGSGGPPPWLFVRSFVRCLREQAWSGRADADGRIVAVGRSRPHRETAVVLFLWFVRSLFSRERSDPVVRSFVCVCGSEAIRLCRPGVTVRTRAGRCRPPSTHQTTSVAPGSRPGDVGARESVGLSRTDRRGGDR